MRHIHPLILDSGAQPKRPRRKRFARLAPLVLMVWFAYWIGIVSQTCCAPLLSDAHANSIPCADGHDGHHDNNALAVHEPAAPPEHGNCPQLKSVELVPVSMASTSSASKPVLIALLPTSILPAFSTSNPPTRHFLDQPSQPPPSPYLRTRRLLI